MILEIVFALCRFCSALLRHILLRRQPPRPARRGRLITSCTIALPQSPFHDWTFPRKKCTVAADFHTTLDSYHCHRHSRPNDRTTAAACHRLFNLMRSRARTCTT